MSDYERLQGDDALAEAAIAEGTHVLDAASATWRSSTWRRRWRRPPRSRRRARRTTLWTELINNETLRDLDEAAKRKDAIMRRRSTRDAAPRRRLHHEPAARVRARRADAVNSIEIVRDYGPDDALILLSEGALRDALPHVDARSIPIRSSPSATSPRPATSRGIAVPYDIERPSPSKRRPDKAQVGRLLAASRPRARMTIVHSLDMANLSMIPRGASR